MWAATDILLGLRYPAEQIHQWLLGVKSMKESTTYQAILQEGKALGQALGEAKGEVKGALKEARKMILRLGQSRFGPPEVVQVAALEGITDLARLENLGERLLQVESWQELLRQPAPRRPSRRRPPTP